MGHLEDEAKRRGRGEMGPGKHQRLRDLEERNLPRKSWGPSKKGRLVRLERQGRETERYGPVVSTEWP